MIEVTKKTTIWLIVLGSVLFLSVVVFFLMWDSYPRFAREQLQGEIEYVQYRPNPHEDLITVTDKAMIEEVRYWVLSAERPTIFNTGVTFPSASCDLVIQMKDGRQIAMLISFTEFDGLNPADWISYAMIRWGGYHRVGDNQPFSSILTRMGLRAFGRGAATLPDAGEKKIQAAPATRKANN